jgi:hypothetical protein
MTRETTNSYTKKTTHWQEKDKETGVIRQITVEEFFERIVESDENEKRIAILENIAKQQNVIDFIDKEITPKAEAAEGEIGAKNI